MANNNNQQTKKTIRDASKPTASEYRTSFERLKKYMVGKTVVVPDGDKKLKLKTIPNTANYQDPMWGYIGRGVRNTRLFSQFYNNPEGQRILLFSDYNMMERDPIIARALSLISEETCLPDENDEIIHIHTDNEMLKVTLEHLFYEILKVDFSLQSWVRQMLKYGDCFVYLNLQEKVGVTDAIVLPSSDVERIEDDNKGTIFKAMAIFSSEIPEERMLHFRNIGNTDFLPYGMCLKHDTLVSTPSGDKMIKDIQIGDEVFCLDLERSSKTITKVLDTVCSGSKQLFKIQTKTTSFEASEEHRILVQEIDTIQDPDNPNDPSFRQVIFPLVYKNVSDLKVGDILFREVKGKNLPLQERIVSIEATTVDVVYDIYVENENHNFFANGIVVHNSHLEPIRRHWRMSTLLEDFMMVYYLLRSVNQRVLYMDMGSIPSTAVDSFINMMRDMNRREPIINPKTGEYDLFYDPITLIEDIIVPMREGYENARYEEIPASPETNIIEGLNFLRQKVMAGLGVPNFLLNYEEQLNSRATASSEDVRMAKFVESVQRIIISELEKVAFIHLLLLGFEKNELFNFSLSLTPPSNLHEMEKLELLDKRIETATSLLDSGLFGKDWVWENIFNLSEAEIEVMKAMILQDKLDEKMTEDQISKFEFDVEEEDPMNAGDTEAGAMDLPESGEGSQGGQLEPNTGLDDTQMEAPEVEASDLIGDGNDRETPTENPERRLNDEEDRDPDQ